MDLKREILNMDFLVQPHATHAQAISTPTSKGGLTTLYTRWLMLA